MRGVNRPSFQHFAFILSVGHAFSNNVLVDTEMLGGGCCVVCAEVR